MRDDQRKDELTTRSLLTTRRSDMEEIALVQVLSQPGKLRQ